MIPGVPIWLVKGIVLAACVAIFFIRAPHGQRSRGVPVVERRMGALERVLLTFAMLTYLAPLAWVLSPLLGFADYTLHPAAFAAGLPILVLGLWLFHRSHRDLGRNWSITLEIREEHRLVTEGLYRHVRHPMYFALLLYGLGQALMLPNWIAGPSYLVSMGLIVAWRLGPEERMMRETFGAEYEAYRARTKRIVPGVW